MKLLTIVRHAKTKEAAPTLRDFDRELTERGYKDAQAIGAFLHRLEPAVDWVTSSTAARARATTEQLTAGLQLPDAPQWRDDLYGADGPTLLAALSESPPRAEHVAVVAHNPGLESLAAGLCATAPARVYLSLSPAGIAHLSLDITQWDQLRLGCGYLEFLLQPKQMRQLRR